MEKAMHRHKENMSLNSKHNFTYLRGYAKMRWPKVTKLVSWLDMNQASDETLNIENPLDYETKTLHDNKIKRRKWGDKKTKEKKALSKEWPTFQWRHALSHQE